MRSHYVGVCSILSFDSYRFVPLQGLRLVDRVKTGVIVDFTEYLSNHINIYVIEGKREASMYKLEITDENGHALEEILPFLQPTPPS